jgi:hypothetical protein
MKVEFGVQLRPDRGWLVYAALDLIGRRFSGLSLAQTVKPQLVREGFTVVYERAVRHLPEVELYRA